MTDTTNLDLLRRLDPLDMSTTAELDPDGVVGRRVRAAAIAAAQRPGLTTHGATITRGAPRRAPRIAAGATAVAALAAIALAVGLPGGGGGSPTAPADARAALVSAAERTTAFTSGHIVWKMAYDQPSTGAPGVNDINMELVNDVRFEGSDVDITGTTHDRSPQTTRPESSYGFRAVGGKGYWRYEDGPFELDKNPAGDTAGGVQVRLQAAEALAAAARAATDVQEQTTVDGATKYTATVAAADVPDQFRPPLKRTVDAVTITAIADDDGALRSLALRAPGEAVDVTFSELGTPQDIVAP
jgi:hypothetical protein